jgi:hypothetical protein
MRPYAGLLLTALLVLLAIAGAAFAEPRWGLGRRSWCRRTRPWSRRTSRRASRLHQRRQHAHAALVLDQFLCVLL